MSGQHGNIVGIGNQAGTVLVTYEYDAWGNITSATGDATIGSGQLLREANPFRYSGYWDAETGLYYLNARYYSPKLGRFLSQDPVPGSLADGTSQNKYLYARNNPVIYIDPTGLLQNPENDLAPGTHEEIFARYNNGSDLVPSSGLPAVAPSIKVPEPLSDTAKAAIVGTIDAFIGAAIENVPKILYTAGKTSSGLYLESAISRSWVPPVNAVAGIGFVSLVVAGIQTWGWAQRDGWAVGLGRGLIEFAAVFAAGAATLAVVGAVTAVTFIPALPVAILVGVGANILTGMASKRIQRLVFGS